MVGAGTQLTHVGSGGRVWLLAHLGHLHLYGHSMVLPTALTASQLHQGIFVNTRGLQACQHAMAAGSFLPHLCVMALSWAQK